MNLHFYLYLGILFPALRLLLINKRANINAVNPESAYLIKSLRLICPERMLNVPGDDI